MARRHSQTRTNVTKERQLLTTVRHLREGSQLNASPHRREIMKIYCEAVHGLAMDMADKLTRSRMGLSSGRFGDWFCQLRMNKYSFIPETVGFTVVQLHADTGFLAILQDDHDMSGLEVMDKSGSFVPINPWPGTFLVDLGDVAVEYPFFIN